MVSSNQFNKQSIIILLYISVVKSDKQERSRIVQKAVYTIVYESVHILHNPIGGEEWGKPNAYVCL